MQHVVNLILQNTDPIIMDSDSDPSEIDLSDSEPAEAAPRVTHIPQATVCV